MRVTADDLRAICARKVHGTLHLSCWGTWSLGCTRSCHIGRKVANAKEGQDMSDGL